MPMGGYLTPEVPQPNAGLTKEELLKYAHRPLWVWLRGTLITMYWLVLFTMLTAAVFIIMKNSAKCKSSGSREWWQQSPIYQIQVASFSDGDHPGDGRGDIAGLENRLDYIEKLGIRTVCLSPIFDSPIEDPSSVTNFSTVAPHIGTLEDFSSLLQVMKEKDMKLILDFIPNHTSDLHHWFQKSIMGEDPYTDFYVWRGPAERDLYGTPIPPNNKINAHNDSAWEWNEERQEFYLHQFSRNKPVLNYHSPELLQEMKEIASFWLKLGVDGFRLDGVAHLDGLDILKVLREVLDNSSTIESKVLLVEDHISLNTLPRFYGNISQPLAHMVISKELSYVIDHNTSAADMFQLVRMSLESVPGGGWPNWMVGAKDVQRLASRMGSSLAEGINMITLLLPGTPLTYYGDEIGMEDLGGTGEKHLFYSPMQWKSDQHFGCCDAELNMNGNHQIANVAAQEKANWSHMKLYRVLVETRQSDAIMDGDIQLKLIRNQIFAFTRIKRGVPGILVAVNFNDTMVTIDLTNMDYVPAMSSIVALSTNYKGSNYKIRGKISNNAVYFPAKGGLVLMFVPNFPIDESDEMH